MSTPPLADLTARATALPHRLLGLVGAPGAGKSTLAARLADAVPGAVVVPMDGFHLPTSVLRERGRIEQRGAPDTFDAEGYVAWLRRLRDGDADGDRDAPEHLMGDGDVMWAPDFDRAIEEPVPDAIRVPRDASLVITEGNYLLLDTEPWRQIPGMLDEIWFVNVPEALRVQRLIARLKAFGWTPGAASGRVRHGSDADNATLVAATCNRADLVVEVD